MIRTDSRKVKKGDTFIAIRGVETDGHDYILDAIKNGATKIICEEGDYDADVVIVKDTREYLNNYLYENIYPKIKDMKLIGVTGTNGKTTTCFLVYQMLNHLSVKCAFIGTTGFYCRGEEKALNNTTPDADILYELLLEAKEKGCEAVVMECSSHALDKDRIYGLMYDEVAFTNLTQDHLDYHKTLDNYAEAKKKLFLRTRGEKIAVINMDDAYYERFLNNENKNILVGTNGDVKILDTKLTHMHTSIKFSYEGKNYETKINMIGKYNVYNYLTALILVNKMGFDIDNILSLNNILTPPAGRMQMVLYKNNSIFIDYAHTPDAVINVLKNAEEYKKGKIITIIGCGGNRDRTKRPLMGEAAEKYSDYVIFTNDNPRCEDEKIIMKDILEGVKGKNYDVIYDRGKAIEKGIDMLHENDILMILGKGHETYQIIGTEKVPFSDLETVNKCIGAKNV